MMVQGQANVSTTTVMAGMLAIGLVGLALDIALRQAERLAQRHRAEH
jgi:NitT/TauT family transport system permease protein